MHSMMSEGVTMTPTRFDSEAATMAPATLPFAMDVKVTEEFTVEGTKVRNRMPR